MIYGITYADEKMTQSAGLCVRSMEKNGVESTTNYSNHGLGHEFIDMNGEIFDSKRGAGCYWLFKPYVIYQRMQQLKDDSILIYADAGVEFVAPVSNIIDRMDEDIFFFSNGHKHFEWCKMDAMQTILGCISSWKFDNIASYTQVQASVIFFKVNENTRNFVKEWLLYCQMPGLIDDSPSKLPNYPTFADHRHDQAILTCLQIKYGYKTHFWPTNYSEHIRHTAQPGDDYPVLFNHHRKRDPGKGDGQPEWE